MFTNKDISTKIIEYSLVRTMPANYLTPGKAPPVPLASRYGIYHKGANGEALPRCVAVALTATERHIGGCSN
jgi:hypothetical protein